MSDESPATDTAAVDPGVGAPGTEPAEPAEPAVAVDLDAIDADLDGVEQALRRLADDTYWTDEVTGETIPDHVLASNPIARRA